MRAIQITETATTAAAAIEMLEGLALQNDYLGGRTYYGDLDGLFHVQAFMQDAETDWLPDGCKRVFIPTSLRQSLRIK